MNGQCICVEGFSGPDCSTLATETHCPSQCSGELVRFLCPRSSIFHHFNEFELSVQDMVFATTGVVNVNQGGLVQLVMITIQPVLTFAQVQTPFF